jgi:cyclophilin family peptidyl-prolyl cis-trans isomerase
VRKALLVLISTLVLGGAAPRPKVRITTNLGAFTLQLEPDAAPLTVQNFLAYVRKGHYSGTIFQRIAKAPAVIQGGGELPNGTKKPADKPVKIEADLSKAKGLSNRRGTVAMARTSIPDSATCQFFVNTKDNVSLDFRAKNLADYGYTVFGKVIQGMEVVDRIAAQPVKGERPVKDVLIQSAEEVK